MTNGSVAAGTLASPAADGTVRELVQSDQASVQVISSLLPPARQTNLPQLLPDTLRLTMRLLVFRDEPHRHTERIRGVGQPIDEAVGVPGWFRVEVGERVALGLGDIEHRRGLEPHQALRPLLGWRLVVVTVAVLVVARRVLALWHCLVMIGAQIQMADSPSWTCRSNSSYHVR